jgi:hypothetical protein
MFVKILYWLSIYSFRVAYWLQTLRWHYEGDHRFTWYGGVDVKKVWGK